jgi:lactoylglutathione lyase
MTQFKGVYPISGEDLSALPVKEIGPAVEFYKKVLRFAVVASDDSTATIQRDDARLGLVRKPDHKPEKAGSCAFAVADLDMMRAELDGRGLDLGGIRIDEWNGKKYRVFFLREAENGYCYCFNQRLGDA